MNSLNIAKNHKLLPYGFILFTVIFWGLSFISTKVVLKEMPPISIAFIRQIIAFAPLAAWTAINKSFEKMPLKDLAMLAVSSFFGIVLYFIFENNGLRLTTSSNASMISSSVPIFTLLAEIAIFKAKANLKVILCILVSVTGVYLVISINGRLDFSSSTFGGNLLMMGAMTSWVVYTIFSRGLGRRYSTMTITTYQTAISAILFIPFVVPEIKYLKPISMIAVLNLLYLGLFCSALAYFLFLYALKRLGATVSAAFLNLIPVVSVIGGMLILSEKLTLTQVTGMALIILSLYGMNIKIKKAG